MREQLARQQEAMPATVGVLPTQSRSVAPMMRLGREEMSARLALEVMRAHEGVRTGSPVGVGVAEVHAAVAPEVS
eukprot:2188208-Rhodomonas_salina.1